MASYRIRLRFYASLRKRMPDAPVDQELEGPTTVGELLTKKGLPEGAAAIVLRNGGKVGPDTLLADGDSLEVFPLIGGG